MHKTATRMGKTLINLAFHLVRINEDSKYRRDSSVVHPSIPPISVFSERVLIAGFAVRLAFLYPSKDATSKVVRESPVPRQ